MKKKLGMLTTFLAAVAIAIPLAATDVEAQKKKQRGPELLIITPDVVKVDKLSDIVTLRGVLIKGSTKSLGKGGVLQFSVKGASVGRTTQNGNAASAPMRIKVAKKGQKSAKVTVALSSKSKKVRGARKTILVTTR